MSETLIPASVAKKLLAVMSDVGYIQKDKKNSFDGYKYASERAIKGALHPALVRHGLLLLPVGCEIVSEAEWATVKDGKEKKERMITIRYSYRWLDAETGEASDILNSMGTGLDRSDKCIYKAITGSLKYIITSTFLIPTGDDPEREEAPKDSPKAKQQALVGGETQALVAKPKVDRSKAFADIKARIGDKAYGVILRSWEVSDIAELSEISSRAAYQQMATTLKVIAAASHGEFISGMSEEIFNCLPDNSVVAIEREYLKKLIALSGEDGAADEFEAIRGKSATQYEFCQLLQVRIDALAKAQGM